MLCLLVAEAVKLNVELKNPLQIPVAVSGISLICQLSTTLDALSSGKIFFPEFFPYRVMLTADALHSSCRCKWAGLGWWGR